MGPDGPLTKMKLLYSLLPRTSYNNEGLLEEDLTIRVSFSANNQQPGRTCWVQARDLYADIDHYSAEIASLSLRKGLLAAKTSLK